MALDPQTKALLDAMNAVDGPKLYEMAVKDARMALEAISIENGGKPQELKKVENRDIDGPNGAIPVRIYWPEKATGKLPLLIFYHGGGFALGNLDSHDGICRTLCHEAGIIVVNVHYRQPPEHPFPAAPEDCYAALDWTAQNAESLGGDVTRIVVAGDSAGGNLATSVCLMAKEKGGPSVSYQILCYPGLMRTANDLTPSRKKFGGGGYFLSAGDVQWIADMYTPNPDDLKNPLAYPLLANDLSRLPPALVISAGNDMLHDEDKEFAENLHAAGVDTEYVDYTGTIHGFISFNGVLDVGRDALALITQRLKERLR